MKHRIDREKKFWNTIAHRYDGFVWKNASITYNIVLNKLVEDTSKSGNVLEIATGTGIIALHLSAYVSKITAIDIASEMIRVAQQKCREKSIRNIDFRIGDSCNLEFSDKTFDTIIASNVLHLLFKPTLALTEMKRVLKDDGTIIVPTFCHGANLQSHILSRLMGLFGFRARSRWSRKTFRQFVQNNGYTILKEDLIRDKIPLVYVMAKKE